MNTPDLATAIIEIQTEAHRRLQAAAKTEEHLARLTDIVDGDTTIIAPTPPALWIFPSAAPAQSTRGLTETWNVDLELVAVVNMAEEKYRDKAIQIAAQASSVLLKDRRLGKPWIQDVLRRQMAFRTGRGPDRRRNLYFASAGITIRFNIREEMRHE